MNIAIEIFSGVLEEFGEKKGTEKFIFMMKLAIEDEKECGVSRQSRAKTFFDISLIAPHRQPVFLGWAWQDAKGPFKIQLAGTFTTLLSTYLSHLK